MPLIVAFLFLTENFFVGDNFGYPSAMKFEDEKIRFSFRGNESSFKARKNIWFQEIESWLNMIFGILKNYSKFISF